MSEVDTKPAPAPKPEVAPAPVANPHGLSPEELVTLHRIFSRSGDKKLGALLDKHCVDSKCEYAEDEEA